MWSRISLWHWFAFPCGWWGFPDSSIGQESACNAGDSGLIPGLGRSPGEEIGYPLQYSWASLVAQLVKTLPAMRETWIRSLCLEDPLEKGKVTHSSILAWRIPWTDCLVHGGRIESDMTEQLSLHFMADDVEHLLRCLLAICISFFGKEMYIQIFCPCFKLSYLSFNYWDVRVCYLSWIYFLHQIYDFQIFFLLSGFLCYIFFLFILSAYCPGR